MKLVTMLLAAASFLAAGAAKAQIVERYPQQQGYGSLYQAADDVEREADVLTQVLRREGADSRVAYNSALVLDASIQLLQELSYDAAVDVLDAHRTLHEQWRYAQRRPSANAELPLRRLDRAVAQLQAALQYGAGQGYPGQDLGQGYPGQGYPGQNPGQGFPGQRGGIGPRF